VHYYRYAQGIVFEDPITRVTDINAYQLMIRAIKTLFNITFDLHDVTITKADEVTTRCASHVVGGILGS
jgi:hypothetical protein